MKADLAEDKDMKADVNSVFQWAIDNNILIVYNTDKLMN